MKDNRIQFRLNRKVDVDIIEALEGYDNRTDRVKQLIRYGISYEERQKALQEGKIVIDSPVKKLTAQQENFIYLTKRIKEKQFV